MEFRSPTLNTILMIENFIYESSGKFNRRELWLKLPKKVMWQTYLVVLEYLENIEHINFGKDEKIFHIHGAPEEIEEINKAVEKEIEADD